MSLDWDEIDKQSNTNTKYKAYAPKGEYKVKLDHVEIRDKATWKSPAMEFHWQETDEYKFPKSCTHWLSIPNPSYRAGHNRDILLAFGFDNAKAKELVEAAERNQDRIKLIQGYEALYKRIAERGLEATITVHDQYDRDGKPVKSANGTIYAESDFKAYRARVASTPKEEAATPSEAPDPDSIPF